MITLLAEQPCVDPPTESKEKRIKKTNGEEKKKRRCILLWSRGLMNKIKLN